MGAEAAEESGSEKDCHKIARNPFSACILNFQRDNIYMYNEEDYEPLFRILKTLSILLVLIVVGYFGYPVLMEILSQYEVYTQEVDLGTLGSSNINPFMLVMGGVLFLGILTAVAFFVDMLHSLHKDFSRRGKKLELEDEPEIKRRK